MSLRIALVTAPVTLSERYGLFAGAASTEPSFGLACLAAVAREAGAETALVEAAARNMTLAETVDEILRFAPHMVGFSATTAGIVAAAETAAQVKTANPNLLTIFGGCHISALPEDTMRAYKAIDLAVVGEGELTLQDIIRHIDPAAPAIPRGLAGTVEREGEDSLRRNPARPLIPDLDTLPLPAWDLLKGFPRAYRPSPMRVRRWPCASVVFTRGCPNQCVFCDRSVFGHRCRAYSPDYAVRMITALHDRYGVREILIEDDTFVIAHARVAEFCERLLAARLDISWSCLGRADRVTPDLLQLMRKAGCWHISYGIESGDPAILSAMHKHLQLDQIRQALAWSREAGLRTKGFFIVGFPGESPSSLAKTRTLANSLPLDDISVMQMTPFPGSELFAIAGRYGHFDQDWQRMNALDTVFVPTGFTLRDLEKARSQMLWNFYLRPGILWRYLRHVSLHPRLWIQTLRGFLVLLKMIPPVLWKRLT